MKEKRAAVSRAWEAHANSGKLEESATAVRRNPHSGYREMNIKLLGLPVLGDHLFVQNLISRNEFSLGNGRFQLPNTIAK